MSNQSFKVKNGLTLTPVDPSTLVAPQSGDIICDSTDNNKIKQYDSLASSWTTVGSGSASLSTIFQLIGDDVAQWSSGNNASFLGGGTLAGTFAAETSSPLDGIQSYKYTQAAGSLNDYISCAAQPVPQRFRGVQTTLYFPYTYNGSNNDIEVIVYDVTNSAIIPNSAFIQASISNAIFKTNITIPTTCTSIRVGFMTRVANSGKIFAFDDVQLTSDTTIYANQPNITSWQSYTPTFQGFGSPTNIEFQYRQVGQNIEIRGKFTVGAIVSAEARVGLPTGFTSANTTLIPSLQNCGIVDYNTGTAASFYALIEPSVTYLTIGRLTTSTGGLTKVNTNVFVSNTDVLSFFASVPCSGLQASSSQILTAPETFSTDTAALAYSSTYTLSTLSTAPVGTYITFTYAANTNTRTQSSTRPNQTDADMNTNGIQLFTRAYNAPGTAASPTCIAIQIGKGLKGKSIDVYKSTGKSVAGNLDYYLATSNATQGGVLYKDYNEVTGILLIDCGQAGSSTVTSSFLNFSDTTAQTNGYFVINASKNPALTGLGLQTVAARGVNSAGTVIPATTLTTVTYDATKTYDTHGALNAATGVFTAPESGYYEIDCSFEFNTATYALGNLVYCQLYKNSVLYIEGGIFTADRAAAYVVSTQLCTGIYLAKGDTLYVQLYNARTGGTALNAATFSNFFSIHKTSIGTGN